MERITHRYMDGTAWVSLNLVSKMGEHECVGLPITKLAAYENAEEQGLLLRLPFTKEEAEAKLKEMEGSYDGE